MANDNKKFKITYFSDDAELLNKMYMVAQQFDIKADEHGEKGLMKSSAVVLNEGHEDFNKSARQESNNDNDILKSFEDSLSKKYKQ